MRPLLSAQRRRSSRFHSKAFLTRHSTAESGLWGGWCWIRRAICMARRGLAVTRAARAATAMGAELFSSWRRQSFRVERGWRRFSTVLRAVPMELQHKQGLK
jgi:hypothetical protein